MKKSLYALLAVCMLLNVSRQTQCCKLSPYATAALLTGAAGAVFLVAKLYDWLDTDEQLMQQCLEQQQLFADAVNLTYDQLIMYTPNFDEADYEPIDHSFARKYFITTVPETILYNMATALYATQQSVQEYMRFIDHASQELKKTSRVLEKRKVALQSSQQHHATLQKIELLLELIEQVRFKKGLICDCIHHHRAYFSLYELEAAIRRAFTQEIATIQQEPDNRDLLVETIEQAIEQYKRHNPTHFPYVDYLNGLDESVMQLKDAIKNTPVRYKERLAWCHWLVDALDYMKFTVMALAGYTQETYLPGYKQHAQKHNCNIS